MRRVAPLVLLFAACGGETAPALAPRPSLDAIPSTEVPRPLCGDAHEALIREAAPAVGPCGDGVELAYVLVRLGEPVLVVARVEDGEAETWIATEAGPSAALPEIAPATPLDAQALLAAAVLREHGDPRILVHVDDVPEAIRRHVGGPLGHEGERLRAIGLRNDDGEWTECVSYEATIVSRGTVRTDATRFLVAADGRARVPSLSALPELAPTAVPRDVCGSPDELAIRARLPVLPACGPALASIYGVAGTTEGQFLVVSWRDDGATPPARETRVVVRDALGPALPAVLHPSPPADSEALLRLAVLVAHRGPELALDRRSLRGFLDDGPELSEEPRLGISHERGLVRLVALGKEVEPDGPTAAFWTVTRYEATLTTDGALAVETRPLLRHRRVRIENDED